tara:strand:+ start:1893 stop:3116 length:1224 start_codon:yes stop_codon:yes gene_type:complete
MAKISDYATTAATGAMKLLVSTTDADCGQTTKSTTIQSIVDLGLGSGGCCNLQGVISIGGAATGDIVLTGDASISGTTTITTADINGGAIDGAIIGGNAAAAGSFTTLSTSGALTIDNLVCTNAATFGGGYQDDGSGGTISTEGNASFNGTLITNGATTLGSTASVAGTLTASGALAVTGAITGGSTLTMDGLSTLPTVDIGGGAIDGTPIGAASHSTVKATTLKATAACTFDTTVLASGLITASAGIKPGGAAGGTLSVYETGTWTPALSFTTTQPTSALTQTVKGDYIKIGNFVQLQFYLNATGNAAGAVGNLQLGTLPFAVTVGSATETNGSLIVTTCSGDWVDGPQSGQVGETSTTTVALKKGVIKPEFDNINGVLTNMVLADIAGDAINITLRGTITYLTGT